MTIETSAIPTTAKPRTTAWRTTAWRPAAAAAVSPRSLSRILGGATLILALAAGAGWWGMTRHQEHAPVTAAHSAITTAAAPPRATANERGVAPVVYLMSSAERATQVRSENADLDAIRNQLGLAPLDTTVVVAPTAGEADLVAGMLEETNVIRVREGLTEFRLVDLRPATP